MTHCLLLALSRCSIESLPSLSRLTEFLSQQLKLKDAAQLSREITSRIPHKLLQARFQSDDAKEGLTSTARRLLKLSLLGNGNYFEDAKKLTQIIVCSEQHLAAIDQLSVTLADDSERPGSNGLQIVKLWNLAAELFGQKVSAGLEVSNDPDSSDLTSILRFFSIPLRLRALEKEVSETTLRKFKSEWQNLYSVNKIGRAHV